MSETPPPPPGSENMPPPPPDYATAPPGFEPNPDIRTNGMMCHLLALSGLIVPFGNIVGPLIIWLMKKDEQPFVKHHGAEAINFNITASIASILAAISIWVCIGIVLLPAVVICWIVFTIIACVKASKGLVYRYPLSIRLIS